MENARIAGLLDEIADLYELRGDDEFRVRSYRDAARTVRDRPRQLEELVAEGEDLAGLPNIGEATAGKVGEMLETGTCARLEELREAVPEGLTELLRVPGLGPRTAMQLHEELGVSGLDELREAAEEGRVRGLAGMGRKSERNILEGIETVRAAAGRTPLRDAAQHAASLGRQLDGIGAVRRWVVAGSYRRRAETVGDLDVLVRADDRAAAADALVALDGVEEVIGRGEERVSIRLESGLQVDFRFFEEDVFGSALLYFTGSKQHNVALRRRAVERDWKLNEYGLFSGERRLASRTEEAVYHRLGLAYVPPELREDRGELEAARDGELPRLVELDDIRGDLQAHTTASDGEDTIEEMARAARRRGYQYLAITDHSQRVTMAGGLDDDGALRHAERVREVDAGLDDLWLLAGIEVDILRDGSLDLARATLEQLDWVLGAIHYDLSLDGDAMTERLLAAIRSGLLHGLAHPTARLIGERGPIAFDTERVFEACAEHGVFVEIDAQPDRLDLPDHLCRAARDAGVRFTISTDAHRRAGLDLMRYGVDVARRGWLRRSDVLNTRTARQLRRTLGGG